MTSGKEKSTGRQADYSLRRWHPLNPTARLTVNFTFGIKESYLSAGKKKKIPTRENRRGSAAVRQQGNTRPQINNHTVLVSRWWAGSEKKMFRWHQSLKSPKAAQWNQPRMCVGASPVNITWEEKVLHNKGGKKLSSGLFSPLMREKNRNQSEKLQ